MSKELMQLAEKIGLTPKEIETLYIICAKEVQDHKDRGTKLELGSQLMKIAEQLDIPAEDDVVSRAQKSEREAYKQHKEFYEDVIAPLEGILEKFKPLYRLIIEDL